MDIFSRIRHEKFMFCREYGKGPSAIYLGQAEYTEVHNSRDAMMYYGSIERDVILGIPFFRVTAESHLGFGA